MKKILVSYFTLLCVLSAKALKVDKSYSDLQFPTLAIRWDEAMPLGNGHMGALVWQRGNRLCFSLDQVELWDLRRTEDYLPEAFSFDWVKAHIRARDYDPVIMTFDKIRGKYVGPTKIPGASLEFETETWGKVNSTHLFLKSGLCRVDWDSGISLETFVQANQPVGWFVFQNVPESAFSPMLIPPPYGSTLSDLGYKQGEVNRNGNMITYHQEGYGGFFYDVAVGWKRSGNAIVGAWSVTSSLAETKAQEEVEVALHTGLKNAYRGHRSFWKKFWDCSVVSVPDTMVQHQYDREMYKFGSAAREDSYPISLQAVWSSDGLSLPIFKGDYHNDLETQLNYWPAYTGNHLNEGMSLLNTLWNQRDTYKEYTRRFFGKEGINVPGVATLDGHVMAGWIQYHMAQTTGAWLSHHFYLHWKYSADKVFLADRAYPFIRDVAVFLEQQSKVDKDGLRALEYSTSPEINDNSIDAWFSQMTNNDLSLMKFVFTAAAEMADSLGLIESTHWKDIASQLPSFSYDEDGALSIAPNFGYRFSHRHLSHAMPIYPLGQIDVSHSATEQSIINSTLAGIHRYGFTGWCGYSHAWLANLEARARHGNEALEALKNFRHCCLKNSFHAHGDQTGTKYGIHMRAFTLEGNFAYAAGLQEMLLQSHTGIIDVFPALPRDWINVKFDRLRAIGAFLVSAEKKEGELTSLNVYSERGGHLKLRHPKTGEIIECETKAGQTYAIIP